MLATIENARLSLNTPQPGQLTLDSIEIRETARKDEGKLVELALTLPKNMILREADGTETKITLTGARANTVVEAESGRGRETLIEIASARLDQPKTGTWVSSRTALDVLEARRRAEWRLERAGSNWTSKG